MSRKHLAKACDRNCQKKTVPVKVANTDAKDVRITGSFCEWDPKGHVLMRDGHGVWHGELRLHPGRYEYRLLADGIWCDHPDCAERIPNPFGSENCVLSIH